MLPWCTNALAYWKEAAEEDLDAADDGDVLTFATWAPLQGGVGSTVRAEAVVGEILKASRTERVALLEYKIADHTDNIYLHDLELLCKMQSRGTIDQIGLIDEDAAHLEMLLNTGIPIAVNQISCSVIDRRVENGRLGEACSKHDIAILAHGVLLGGFLSEKWLGQSEPSASECGSRHLYMSLIKAAGGWISFQRVLAALEIVAKRHGVSVSAVATRYVLDIPAVSAVVVGLEVEAEPKPLLRQSLDAFSFKFDDHDKAQIAEAQTCLRDISDDDYQRSRSNVANTSISNGSGSTPTVSPVESAVAKGLRVEVMSGSKWEPFCGSLKTLGASLADVVRSRIIIRDKKYCEEVSLAHGAIFQRVGVLPANTLIVAGLIEEEFLVEIEAEAEVGSSNIGTVTL
ncbi:hypothetical protein MBLNU459_g5542t1 [Dothideomycetes sp. NU459]